VSQDSINTLVEFLKTVCEAPQRNDADEIDSSLHAAAVACIASGGAEQFANAHGVLVRLSDGWQHKPTAEILASEAAWIVKQTKEEKKTLDPLAQAASANNALLVQSADAVQPEEIRWVIPLWLASGMLAMAAGDPGVGKSFLACEIAARASRGQSVLGQSIPGPLRVLMVNMEDDPAMVQRPRLEACGADLSNVLLLQEVRIGGKPAPIAIPRDAALLEQSITERGLSLVILDPISAMLPGVDLNDMGSVRAALAPLEGMARRTGCAVLLIHHNRKAAAGTAQQKVGGSTAFPAAARTVWTVTIDGTDENRRNVHVCKSNLGKYPPGHAYNIDGEPARVLWLGETVGSAEDAAAVASLDGSDREALDWLREQLNHGPIPATEALRSAKSAGVDARHLRQLGKRHLGMLTRKEGFDGPWIWSLPSHRASSTSSQKDGNSSPLSSEPPSFFDDSSNTTEEARVTAQESMKNHREYPKNTKNTKSLTGDTRRKGGAA